MRDIINLLDNVLLEGVGLSNRKPGEQFANKEGDVITFQGLEFYPKSGNFKDFGEANAAIDQLTQSLGTSPEMIKWTNTAPKSLQSSGGYAGFGIAHFTDTAGKDYYLGRWFKNINPNRALNNFPHESIPGGFKFQSSTGKKEATGYKPSEVLTEFKSQTPKSIYQQIVAHFGEGSDEVIATEAFMKQSGPKITVPKGNMNETAFRDYFAEMLQPMALVMGKKVSGNADEAADIFFGGPGYTNCVISFNDNPIGNLYDSLLVNPEGKQIKLSSKGKDGAKASVVNLIRAVDELGQTPNGQKLTKQYKQTIDILRIIAADGHVGAPLKLAVQFGIIDPQEAQQVISLKGMGPEDDIIGQDILSKKLETFYQERKAKDMTKIIPLEHLLASIAYKVADYVNDNTDFSAAASTILNYSAFIQMWTTMSTSGDNYVMSFEAKYPGEAVTGVELSAAKSYMSTQGKGNYVFNILRNGATSKDMELLDTQTDTKPDPNPDTGIIDTEKLDVAAQARSSVTAHAGGAEKKLGSRTTLGRDRQK